MSGSLHATNVFEWRIDSRLWRRLLLASLGVAASGCPEPSEPSSSQLSKADVAALHACNNPVPLGGGWERCANGVLHRAQLAECPSSLPRTGHVTTRGYPAQSLPDASGDAGPRPEPLECLRDSDCNAAPHGLCEVSGGEGSFPPLVYCRYACVTDSECGAGEVCVCTGSQAGSCAPATCSTDADCEGDGMCASLDWPSSCRGLRWFACQTPRDQCVTDADCVSGLCTLVQDEAGLARRCVPGACPVIGRPFSVAGDARVAEPVERGDWSSLLPGAAPLESDPELRRAVARGWLEQALMEHASVASFARFSLQLLSLGAPAELVRDAARAQADEIVHAQDCFALARRHGGAERGPGPLSLDGALDGSDLLAIVLGTLAEGCIGETVAALEAAEASAHCADPVARAVLERIAADETRHAELAWRFVAWALETGPESLRGEVRMAFARELDAAQESPPRASDFERRLLQHGLLSAGLRSGLRSRVLSEVVAPCTESLLSRSTGERGRSPRWKAGFPSAG